MRRLSRDFDVRGSFDGWASPTLARKVDFGSGKEVMLAALDGRTLTECKLDELHDAVNDLVAMVRASRTAEMWLKGERYSLFGARYVVKRNTRSAVLKFYECTKHGRSVEPGRRDCRHTEDRCVAIVCQQLLWFVCYI